MAILATMMKISFHSDFRKRRRVQSSLLLVAEKSESKIINSVTELYLPQIEVEDKNKVTKIDNGTIY